MRGLAFFLAVMWLAAGELLAAGATSPVTKSRDGSLVLPGTGENTSATTKVQKKDTLHTLLSREVQVYIFRGGTRVWPQPYVLGQTRFYRPAGHYQPLAGPYLESLIQRYALQYGVDPSLVRAVMRHESGFNPHAVSPKGAQGLMQLMPGTAALMGVNNPFDPEQNIAGGVSYLRYCLDRFQHNVPLAVAAYNAGPERVAKSGGVPAIQETQAFVSNVLGTYSGRTPASLPPAKPPAKATVDRRILPAPVKAASSEKEEEKKAARPRAKVIEVRYPQAKRVESAKPQGAE